MLYLRTLTGNMHNHPDRSKKRSVHTESAKEDGKMRWMRLVNDDFRSPMKELKDKWLHCWVQGRVAYGGQTLLAHAPAQGSLAH
jgi:hypothetical protein